jgi:predicted enzyme related to lactoylglutathione lyase
MEMTSYPEGTPCIADVQVADLAAGTAFYEALFGWTHTRFPGLDGGPSLMCKDGKHVATVAPKAPDPTLAPPMPLWAAYVAVDDVDAVTRQVEPHGGTIVAGPFDVLDKGRFTVITDPSGAPVSLWQGKALKGAELMAEPGALCWFELATRDTEAPSRFFRDILGLDAHELDGPMPYVMLEKEGRPVAGMMPMNEGWPAEIPSHWMVYFQVDDTDGTAARCTELGGTVSVPPTDIPRGRFAVLNDPEGNAFSVLTPAG